MQMSTSTSSARSPPWSTRAPSTRRPGAARHAFRRQPAHQGAGAASRAGPARAHQARARRRRPARHSCGWRGRSRCWSHDAQCRLGAGAAAPRGCRSRSTPTRWPPGSCPALAPLAAGPSFELHREDEAHTARAAARRHRRWRRSPPTPTPVQGCRSRALGAMRYLPWPRPTFARRWFPDGADARGARRARRWSSSTATTTSRTTSCARTRRAAPPRRTLVPPRRTSSPAIGLGLGWGMVPDLQRPGGPELVGLDPAGPPTCSSTCQRWRPASRRPWTGSPRRSSPAPASA